MVEPPAALLDAARGLAPRIRAAADEIEAVRRLPAALVEPMAAAGLFGLCLPRTLGGPEVDVATMVRVLEEVAAADGSAGWCAMIGSTSAVLAAYLDPTTARAIYGGPAVVTGGVFAPAGRAQAVSGGYRVSGRWPFASGCQHCAWLMGGCVVQDGSGPRLLASGVPEPRLMLFPASAAHILDTWSVAGLRGTGSHDVAVEDLFVPAAQSVSLVTDRPQEAGPLYSFPVFGLLALGIAAVGLGIARRAIEELTALARRKTPSLARRLLADRAAVQIEVAQAEAGLSAGRAFLHQAVGDAWETACRDGAITTADRARLRLAATYATTSAARAVDLMYNAGGGTAIYATSPLQRCFRDIHVLTQHTMVAPATWELAGRVLLGLDTDTSML